MNLSLTALAPMLVAIGIVAVLAFELFWQLRRLRIDRADAEGRLHLRRPAAHGRQRALVGPAGRQRALVGPAGRRWQDTRPMGDTDLRLQRLLRTRRPGR